MQRQMVQNCPRYMLDAEPSGSDYIMGASIIDVDSIGEGGGKPKVDYSYSSKVRVINESIKGERAQKIVKMSRRRLWMPPYPMRFLQKRNIIHPPLFFSLPLGVPQENVNLCTYILTYPTYSTCTYVPLCNMRLALKVSGFLFL